MCKALLDFLALHNFQTYQNILFAKFFYISFLQKKIFLQIDNDETDNDTLYYQWVSFMMVHNAILFKIPQLIWKFCEAGIMKKLHSGKGIGSDLMDLDQLERNLETHVASYKKLRGRKSIIYYSKFQLCEVFNYIVLVWIWMQTNRFLSGHFNSYGKEVVEYYAKPSDLREHNPMCNTFPTVVSTFYNNTVANEATPSRRLFIDYLSTYYTGHHV